jgi:hypothetical protein
LTLCPKFQNIILKSCAAVSISPISPGSEGPCLIPSAGAQKIPIPSPLSQMRTELVWDGKYDEYRRPA